MLPSIRSHKRSHGAVMTIVAMGARRAMATCEITTAEVTTPTQEVSYTFFNKSRHHQTSLWVILALQGVTCVSIGMRRIATNRSRSRNEAVSTSSSNNITPSEYHTTFHLSKITQTIRFKDRYSVQISPCTNVEGFIS